MYAKREGGRGKSQRNSFILCARFQRGPRNMAEPPADKTLQYQPFAGGLDVGFLAELGRRKLHEFGLRDDPVDIRGSFACAAQHNVASPLCVSADGFTPLDGPGVPPTHCAVPGTLRNANTLEDFKEWDKSALLHQTASRIWDDVQSGAALAEPERLLRFLLITFADLKTHKYYYWFAFPSFAVEPAPVARPALTLAKQLDTPQLDALRTSYAAMPRGANGAAPLFFVVRRTADGAFELGPLTSFVEWRTAAVAGGSDGLEVWLAFADACPLPANPGWALRNLLLLASQALHGAGGRGGGEAARVRVLCYREPPPGTVAPLVPGAAPTPVAGRSLLLDVALPAPAASTPPAMPTPLGWERNNAGRLGARMMDLSTQMRPETLAEESVDLNLRLMRWRLMPEIQTEMVARQRCLLLGAGTLGCSVARTLLGWGVRHITFVDSGNVSYSNPVRQSLYTFEHCVKGPTPKAQAAADALKLIFPSVVATAHAISIPMPGHAVGDAERERVQSDCELLDRLVRDHDVIFLLTDTRESRWLPTLLAATHRKLAITAALGFDTFVVMRHGLRAAPAAGSAASSGDAGSSSAADAADAAATAFSSAAADAAATDDDERAVAELGKGGAPERLGCYFCNDVVAPANSMLRRTLDQQCTVSRPGLQLLASALAVELAVAVLHHPHGAAADDDISEEGGSAKGDGGAAVSCLGGVPHQIRGTLSRFATESLRGAAFARCTACSDTVVQALNDPAEGGFNFLMRAFNGGAYLEDLTGLTELHKSAEAALASVDFFDDEDEDGELL